MSGGGAGGATERTWTNAELDAWFENDFGGTEAFDRRFTDWGSEYVHGVSEIEGFGPAIHAFHELWADSREERMVEQRLFTNDPWKRLSLETKRDFRSGWEEVQARTVDEAGAVQEAVVDDSVIDDLRPPSTSGSSRGFRRTVIAGGVAAVVVAGVAFVTFSGDDSTSDSNEVVASELDDDPVADDVLATTPTEPEPVVDDPVADDVLATPAPAEPTEPTEPIDYVRVIDPAADFFKLPSDELIVVLTPESPWIDGIPEIDDQESIGLAIAIGKAGSYSGVVWSLIDGATYAESQVDVVDFPDYSQGVDVGQADMWLTPAGSLAVMMRGVSAASIDPSINLVVTTFHSPDPGQPWSEETTTVPVGEIVLLGDEFPGDWIALEPDKQPIVLNVPSG